jgi:predicted PurR-regulated permease PerM
MAKAASPQLRHDIAAWAITAVLLVAALVLGLLPALLAGLLVYELVHVIAPRLPFARGGGRKLAAVAVLAVLVVLLLAAVLMGAITMFRHSHLPMLLQRMAEILDESRARLPDWIVSSIPADTDNMKDTAIGWLREHAAELRHAGGEAGRIVVHILIGLIIGAMVALRGAHAGAEGGPLARSLGERALRVGDAFRRVVFAQVRIAALNALFTAIYLVGILPLLGIDLPFGKTLVAITFIGGLIPIVGNLIANTVIVVISLSVSPQLAIASLVFLVVVHKLEYFLNARIVGAGIRASAWELLVAMLLMEAAFGLPGLVGAPIYYAYVKDELVSRGLL